MTYFIASAQKSSLRSPDDGQSDLLSGAHAELLSDGRAELPTGGQLDYLVWQRCMMEART
jgi:hypothetical protein